jgi:hypothetical protein
VARSDDGRAPQMTTSADVSVPIKHTDRFFIGGE